MRILLLIRHGITEWNIGKILQGQTDIALSGEGKWQAERLAGHLGLRRPPDVLLSSDLSRARETAEAISKHVGTSVQTDRALRERALGELEGMTSGDAAKVMERGMAAEQVDRHAWKPVGGESRADLDQRVANFVRQLDVMYGSSTIWIVSHGGIIRALLQRLVPSLHELSPAPKIVSNASITELQRHGNSWNVVILNDTHHLERSMDERLVI